MSNVTVPISDRHWRVYQRSIETTVRKGAASKALTEYLEAIGYTQLQISPTMTFERGANFASLYNPNPKSQKTEISVDFASISGITVLEVTMRVNCFGNRPLSKDYEFWEAELSGIVDALEHGYVNSRLSDYAAERAMWYSITIQLLVLLVALSVTMSIFFIFLLMGVK